MCIYSFKIYICSWSYNSFFLYPNGLSFAHPWACASHFGDHYYWFNWNCILGEKNLFMNFFFNIWVGKFQLHFFSFSQFFIFCQLFVLLTQIFIIKLPPFKEFSFLPLSSNHYLISYKFNGEQALLPRGRKLFDLLYRVLFDWFKFLWPACAWWNICVSVFVKW